MTTLSQTRIRCLPFCHVIALQQAVRSIRAFCRFRTSGLVFAMCLLSSCCFGWGLCRALIQGWSINKVLYLIV